METTSTSPTAAGVASDGGSDRPKRGRGGDEDDDPEAAAAAAPDRKRGKQQPTQQEPPPPIISTEEERRQALEERLRGPGGSGVWTGLDDAQKWEKRNVWAVLSNTVDERTPVVLWERHWSETPVEIREDRDLLLARLSEEKSYTAGVWNDFHRHFFIPDQFVGDKQVVVAAISHFPEILAQGFPRMFDYAGPVGPFPVSSEDRAPIAEALFDDEQVWCALLNSFKVQTPFTVSSHEGILIRKKLLEKFSTRIRGQAEHIYQVVQRCQDCHYSCSLPFKLFDGPLCDNSSFALELLQKVQSISDDFVLQRFTERVRADRKVVLAYVSQCGILLKDAAVSLQGDEEIVSAACKNDPMALPYCAPGETREALCSNKQFILDILRPITHYRGGNVEVYRMLSAELKKDPKVIAAADSAQSLAAADLPQELVNNVGFWAKMVLERPELWSKVPVQFGIHRALVHSFSDGSFVRGIAGSASDRADVLLDFFGRFPTLANEPSLLKTIVEEAYRLRSDLTSDSTSDSDKFYGLNRVLLRLLADYAPPHILRDMLRDRDFILRACARGACGILRVLPEDLQLDREIIEKVAEFREGIHSISMAAQRSYPDLAARAIFKGGRVSTLPAAVAPELWTNLEIVAAWFRKRHAYFHSHFPPEVKDNQEFALVVAQHGSVEDFRSATSVALRFSKSFMIKAIEANPILIWCGHVVLRRDFDLAVLAITHHQGQFGQFLRGASAEDRLFLAQVKSEVEQRINMTETFITGFLPGMSDRAGSHSELSMLVQDQETSLALKKLIGEMIGVPTGKHLRMLRDVLQKMRGWNN